MRDLNAPETSINEDDRKRVHRSSGVTSGDAQGVLELRLGHAVLDRHIG
jgi:hypothetical protein